MGRLDGKRNIVGKTLEDRFWSFVVTPDDPEKCWEWSGAKRNGYGVLGSGPPTPKKLAYAHRLAYEIHYEFIADGMLICHRCDYRGCVNPWHLYEGTHSDNLVDRYLRGKGSY